MSVDNSVQGKPSWGHLKHNAAYLCTALGVTSTLIGGSYYMLTQHTLPRLEKERRENNIIPSGEAQQRIYSVKRGFR